MSEVLPKSRSRPGTRGTRGPFWEPESETVESGVASAASLDFRVAFVVEGRLARLKSMVLDSASLEEESFLFVDVVVCFYW